MKESKILEKAHKLLDSGKGVALCSIIEKRGSTPRGEGTKILVTEEGETYGTVGGGEFERQLVNEALEAIKKGESKTKTYTLSEEETGLWCGGESTVFFDVMGALPEIVLIGSGNVAKPVYDIANTLDYNVTVVDDNEETLTEERFPDAKRILDEYDQALNKVQTNENTYVVVLQGEPHRDARGVQSDLRSDAGRRGRQPLQGLRVELREYRHLAGRRRVQGPYLPDREPPRPVQPAVGRTRIRVILLSGTAFDSFGG